MHLISSFLVITSANGTKRYRPYAAGRFRESIIEVMTMRSLVQALILGHLALLLPHNAGRSQSSGPSRSSEAAYAAEVWKNVAPPESAPSVIVISVSINSKSKLVLRARDSRTFEFVSGSLKEPLTDALRRMKDSHGSVENPEEVAGRVPIEWKTKALTAEEFSTLHHSFTIAFTKLINDAQARFRDITVNGGRVTLHNMQYHVVYNNDGYENFEAIVDDVPDERGRLSPMVEWVHQLLTLGQTSQPGGPR